MLNKSPCTYIIIPHFTFIVIYECIVIMICFLLLKVTYSVTCLTQFTKSIGLYIRLYVPMGLHSVRIRRICSRTRVHVACGVVIYIIYVCAKSLCYIVTPIETHSIIYTYAKYTPRCSRLCVFSRVRGIYYNSERIPCFTNNYHAQITRLYLRQG